jgi:hypothetical protein
MAKNSSFLNHSCEPNAKWKMKDISVGQKQRIQIEVKAKETIEPNQEICISHLTPDDLSKAVTERPRLSIGFESELSVSAQSVCGLKRRLKHGKH